MVSNKRIKRFSLKVPVISSMLILTFYSLAYTSISLKNTYSVNFVDPYLSNKNIGVIEQNGYQAKPFEEGNKEVARKSVYDHTATDVSNIEIPYAPHAETNTINIQTNRNLLKLPTPIILLGLPKSGTTSVYNFFKCADVPSSHYCCSPGAGDHPPCHPKGTPGKEQTGHMCGYCIKRNIFDGHPPLEGCGDTFDVFAQMDVEMTRYGIDERTNKRVVVASYMYLPQVTALDALHAHYPNATFILNLRNPASWEKSVRNWFNLKNYFKQTHLPDHGYPAGTLALQEFYRNHTKRIRDFAALHPSHAFVEVNIEDEGAGDKMAEAFGLSPSCWGRSNANGPGRDTK